MSEDADGYAHGHSHPHDRHHHDHDDFHRRLYQVASHSLSPQTAQTIGMARVEAISASTVGSSGLWMGQTHVSPDTKSGNHHHGHSETGIYVIRGHPEFVFLEESEHGFVEVRLQTGPGDYVYVPPWVPHREENPDPEDEAIVVIARTTQEAIVMNVEDLKWVGPPETQAAAERHLREWHRY